MWSVSAFFLLIQKKSSLSSSTASKKGVFDRAKFDSHPELLLARVLESDSDVQNWLRPAPQEFNITYNHGHSYEPDFVVETEGVIYLVEVKGEDKLNDPDVIAKKKTWYPVLRSCDPLGKGKWL